MRNIIMVIILMLSFSIIIQADVRLEGELTSTNIPNGVKYSGKIINDTENDITDVKITITVKDSKNSLINVTDVYVDGHNNINNEFGDAYIPAGKIAPFSIYLKVNAKDIASYTYSITYKKTKEVKSDFDNIPVCLVPIPPLIVLIVLLLL